MDNEIEKPEQPNPDDVLAAIQSFNDPSIITNLFRELGWTYSFEIKETITLAKQNSNLSIKFKAIKHLRELLREAAEASGYVANVSKTIPNAQGGQTTFHAKRIAGALNPVKKIESTEIKEAQNGKKETQTQPDRGSDRREGKDSSQAGLDTGIQFPPEPGGCAGGTDSERDAEPGGTEPSDGGETGREVAGGRTPDDRGDSASESPCIQTRPPTCDRELFPGISSAEEH